MTDIVRHEDPANLIHKAAAELADAHRIAEVLVRTSFAPAHFKGKPEEGAVAILYGAGIGMDPMAAIQNIYVIGGKPALYARAMVAVVLSHGHRIWTEESSPERVVVAGQRKGSEQVERSEWTMARAQQAGYTTNANYKKDPEAMLYARASGDVARRIAPDALLGLAHAVEELQASTPIAAPSQRTDRLRAAIGSAPAAEVPSQPEPVYDNPADQAIADGHAGPEPISAQQMKAMHAAFTGQGIKDRDARLAYVSDIIGREVESSKDLTWDEARKVLNDLATAEPTIGGVA